MEFSFHNYNQKNKNNSPCYVINFISFFYLNEKKNVTVLFGCQVTAVTTTNGISRNMFIMLADLFTRRMTCTITVDDRFIHILCK